MFDIRKKKYSLLIYIPALISSFSVNSAVVSQDELDDVAKNVSHAIEHCDEVIAGGILNDIIHCGDELFETRFNALDGAGMNVGDGGRFTRVPRAD